MMIPLVKNPEAVGFRPPDKLSPAALRSTSVANVAMSWRHNYGVAACTIYGRLNLFLGEAFLSEPQVLF